MPPFSVIADDLMEGGEPPRDCKQSLRPYLVNLPSIRKRTGLLFASLCESF